MDYLDREFLKLNMDLDLYSSKRDQGFVENDLGFSSDETDDLTSGNNTLLEKEERLNEEVAREKWNREQGRKTKQSI